MKTTLIVALALLLPCVSAQVVIQQVYYDPLGSETGGEALELFNRGSDPVDVSGWVIATASSARDVVFPEGTVIGPQKPLLVADEGWDDKKDDASWRKADILQTMTLGNSASWVAVKRGNDTIDLVGWGDDAEQAQGSPAQMTKQNQSLIRISRTGDNSRDFIAVPANFAEGILIPITADVTVFVPIIEVSESLDLKPEGTLVVRNNGEKDISVTIRLDDLQGRTSSISRESVSVDGGLSFVVKAGEEHKSTVRVVAPKGAVPGRYQGAMRVVMT